MTHYVYSYHDAEGALLYIGESNNWARRAREHMKYQSWADQIASVAITTHLTQRDAQHDEVRRIRAEQPRYNIVHNQSIQYATRPVQPTACEKEIERLRAYVKHLEETIAMKEEHIDALARIIDMWKGDYQRLRDTVKQPRVFMVEGPRYMTPMSEPVQAAQSTERRFIHRLINAVTA
jgi:hypothetical protein